MRQRIERISNSSQPQGDLWIFSRRRCRRRCRRDVLALPPFLSANVAPRGAILASVFSLFLRAHADADADINYYCGRQSQRAVSRRGCRQNKTKQKSLARSIRNYKRRITPPIGFSVDSSVLFSIISRTFFLSPISLFSFFLSSLILCARTRARWTGRDRACHRSSFHPRCRHARSFYVLGPVPLFYIDRGPSLLTPFPRFCGCPPPPRSLIYLFVFAVLISVRSPTPISGLLSQSFASRNHLPVSRKNIDRSSRYPPGLKWVVVVAANWHRHLTALLDNNNDR